MFYYNGKAIKRVGFVGVGKSNIGIWQYLSRHNTDLEVTVRAETAGGTLAIPAKRYLFGDVALSEIDEDILFLSPSARRDGPELSKAIGRGVILSSDSEFFFRNSEAEVYGITGSDGKSTTTYLTRELLSESGRRSVAFGNFGEAMTPHIDDTESTLYVAELSSFQLTYDKPKTVAAAITNITKNHLNWHSDFNEYINAKRNVLENTSRRIFNYDCEVSRGFIGDYRPYAVYSRFLGEEELKKRTFAELYLSLSDGAIFASGERLLDMRDILVPGDYNVSNFMCAIALTYDKLSLPALSRLAKGFGGLPNRRELAGCFSGVRYYNSSIDSSPKRCIATLGSFDKRVILILGGRSKGLDFSELVPHLKRKTKLVILTGETAEELQALCKKEYVNHVRIDGFEEAVLYAVGYAREGDTVLLSPAATSYDRFKNFEERGRFFKELIKPKGK